MGLFGWLFGWRARAKIEKAFHATAEILFVHLQRQYSSDRTEGRAMELATVVTMALLGPPPADVAALASLPVDPRLVEARLGQVKDDAEVCWIVSLFRHSRNRVAGAVTPATRAADERLQKLGILLPAEQVRLPASHRGLMREIRNFELYTRRA